METQLICAQLFEASMLNSDKNMDQPGKRIINARRPWFVSPSDLSDRLSCRL